MRVCVPIKLRGIGGVESESVAIQDPRLTMTGPRRLGSEEAGKPLAPNNEPRIVDIRKIRDMAIEELK